MPQCSLRNIKIHVEVPIFLLLFTFMFESSVTTNFIIYRTCYVTLGFNESECALLGRGYTTNETAKLEEAVQPHAAVILMWRALAGSIIPSILCFFLGPWSDKYGRKPVMLCSFTGFIIAYLIMTTVSAIPNASPWYILLYFIPVSITGGFPSVLASMLSYITDVTSEENRGVRMGVFEAVYTIGVLVGILSSSYMFNAFGYEALYSICTICVVLAWLFILLLIPESVPNVEQRKGRLYYQVFKFSLMEETIRTILKKRDYNGRGLLLIVMSLMIIFVVTNIADCNMVFLYLREEFLWSLKMFTFYISINNATSIIGSIVGAYILNKLLHVGEITVIFLGLLSSLLGSLFLGLATQNWHIYAAACTKCFGGAISPMVRSLLSKLVPTEDSGKVFSVIAALEATGALIGSPVYTYIYNSTLLTFPGAFNFLTVGILCFEMILTIAIFVNQKYQDRKL